MWKIRKQVQRHHKLKKSENLWVSTLWQIITGSGPTEPSFWIFPLHFDTWNNYIFPGRCKNSTERGHFVPRSTLCVTVIQHQHQETGIRTRGCSSAPLCHTWACVTPPQWSTQLFQPNSLPGTTPSSPRVASPFLNPSHYSLICLHV